MNYSFKKLSNVDSENNFTSSSSKHFIVEDGNSIKRLSADSISSEPFIITVTNIQDLDCTVDKEVSEIEDAINSGKVLYIKINVSGAYVLLPLTWVQIASNGISGLRFTTSDFDVDDGTLIMYTCVSYWDGQWTIREY